VKRVLFVTKSKLAQNLLGIIIQSIPKKIELVTLDDLKTVGDSYFAKPINLILLDESVIVNTEEFKNLDKTKLKNAKRILIHKRNSKVDKSNLGNLGIKQFHAKPFLTEEILDWVT